MFSIATQVTATYFYYGSEFARPLNKYFRPLCRQSPTTFWWFFGQTSISLIMNKCKGAPFMETWLGYFILGFVLSTPICPVNIEMIRQGAANGFFPSWLVGLGDVLSNLLIIGIIFCGFSSWFSDFKYLSVFAIISGCYLIYLGVTNLKAEISISLLIRPVILLGQGFILGLVNPIDFLSWLGVYSTIQHLPPSFLATAVVYLLIGCGTWNLILSLSVSWCRHFLKPAYIRRFQIISGLILCIYGLFFAGYGLKLLME